MFKTSKIIRTRRINSSVLVLQLADGTEVSVTGKRINQVKIGDDHRYYAR